MSLYDVAVTSAWRFCQGEFDVTFVCLSLCRRGELELDQLAHTDSYDRWLTNNGIRVWNEINNDIKKLPFAPFKSELKKEILKSYQNIQTPQI